MWDWCIMGFVQQACGQRVQWSGELLTCSRGLSSVIQDFRISLYGGISVNITVFYNKLMQRSNYEGGIVNCG